MTWETAEALPDYVEKAIGNLPEEETIRTREILVHKVYRKDLWTARDYIIDWCLKNIGFCPEITHEKDHLMLDLYDDRVKQVVPNKGELVEDIARIQSREIQKCERIFNGYERENLRLSRNLDCKFNGFLAGMMLGALITGGASAVVIIVLRSKMPQTEALNHLHSAIIEVQESLDTPSK